MSYIDTFGHEFMGFFAGLPIYRSLVDWVSDDGNPQYFSCSKSDLIVGGGPGEHLALLVRNPEQAVSYFFREWLEKYSDLDQESYEEGLLDFPDWNEVLVFCGWRLENYQNFIERCKSVALVTPYTEGEYGYIENWLYTSFGEFIFFSYPEMAKEIIDKNSVLAQKIKRPFINNILLQPRGCLQYGGVI